MKNEKRKIETVTAEKGRMVCFFAFLISSFLLLTGCPQPHTVDNVAFIPAGKGSFSLTLSGAERTILPATPSLDDFAIYNLTFTPASGGSFVSVDRTNDTLSTEQILLDPGTYNLVVNAYKDSGKTQLMARGTLDGIVITTGQNTAKTVELEALLSNDTEIFGTFSWSITVPSDVTSADMIIAPANASGMAQQTVTLSVNNNTGSRTLNSGQYNVTINLESPSGRVVWKELLYVYQNLDSNFPFIFTNEYFSGLYTVTYDSNGGSNVGQQSVLYGRTVSAPVNPVKAGYSFVGWYTDNNTFANAYNFSNAITGDITLYAKYMPFEYIITGSGTSFTATRSGSTVGTANQPIQTVINAIRTNAAINACTIQFGSGGADELDIGTASAEFTSSWGIVTLTGKITSTNTTATQGTVMIGGNVSVTSTADIINTGSNANARAIYNAGTGAVTLSGGTVSADTGVAMYNNSTGSITVSGTAVVTSANISSSEWLGTIYLANSGTATASRLNITGGTVKNTATGSSNNGSVVRNASTGAVNISGGMVECSNNVYARTVYNSSTGVVTISGGTVSATVGVAVYNNAGTVNVSGGTVSTTTGQAVSMFSLTGGSTGAVRISGGMVSSVTGAAVSNESNGLVTVSGTAIITSAGDGSTISIPTSVNIATSSRLNITGGTVENTGYGNAIRNASPGAVNISGGTVLAKDEAVYQHCGAEPSMPGALTISGGTISVSATGGIAVYNRREAQINLRGNPVIIGVIHRADTGAVLSVAGTPSFNPTAGRKYILRYSPPPPSGTVVITGGGNFLSYFEMAPYNFGDGRVLSLAVNGNDLVLLITQ